MPRIVPARCMITVTVMIPFSSMFAIQWRRPPHFRQNNLQTAVYAQAMIVHEVTGARLEEASVSRKETAMSIGRCLTHCTALLS